MRSFAIVTVFALLLLVSVSAVPVPFKWCGSSSDDATVDSIDSNEFPPVKGDTLSLNVTGNLTKAVTSGTYTIAITVGGFPLPDLTGDISSFRPLPWPVGDLNFTYSQAIPSAAPSGSYVVKISAVDQDSTQIFCVSIAFSLKAARDEDVMLMEGVQYSSSSERLRQSVEQLQSLRPIRRVQPISRTTTTTTTNSNSNKVQRIPAMPIMKPLKQANNRRL